MAGGLHLHLDPLLNLLPVDMQIKACYMEKCACHGQPQYRILQGLSIIC